MWGQRLSLTEGQYAHFAPYGLGGPQHVLLGHWVSVALLPSGMGLEAMLRSQTGLLICSPTQGTIGLCLTASGLLSAHYNYLIITSHKNQCRTCTGLTGPHTSK